MAEYQDREHYIPLRKRDLLELLCRDRGFSPGDASKLRKLAEMLSATFHYEYNRHLEELKDAYAPFDPDATTKVVFPISADQRQELLGKLFEKLGFLMERANFKHLSEADLEKAEAEVSEWGLYMDVDTKIFDRMEIYARGDTVGTRYLRRWFRFWKLEEIRVPVYRRLVLFVKMKASKRLPKDLDTDDVFLKIFKEIPKSDMEMMLPGARTKMPTFERLKLGGSVLGGVGGLLYTLASEILNMTILSTQFLLGPVVALLGVGYRQYAGYMNTQRIFSHRLTQSLYFQTLGNNLSTLFHLLDEAEEQEFREAILAYYYLWRFAGEKGWTAKDLDEYVEMDLERLANLKVDFEIGDAIAKLERLKLVSRVGDRFVAVPIDRALIGLDEAWDSYFQYHKA